MACAELQAFRVATESLDSEITRSTRLGRAMFWRNLFPKETFVQNQGVLRSTFTIKPSEPSDNQALWTPIVTTNGLIANGCNPQYEDIGVGFFERTYGPKRRDFRGPVICKENLQFQHAIDEFISGYVDELGQVLARVWEFAIRGEVMAFSDWFVDGVKTLGPGAVATAPRPYQGLSQALLEQVAVDLINTGAAPSEANGDYVFAGNAGPIYPLYVDMVDSENIVRANQQMREDARYASMGKDGEGDFAIWKAIGSNRVIGNFRHITTNIAPRGNYVQGVGIVPVTPFKDITAMGNDQETLTDAYKNAPFAAAIVAIPEGMTLEVVKPQTAGLGFKPTDYNGNWDFVTGGYRVCDPAIYDPQEEKGRHFANIMYAARPRRIHSLKTIWYKRCPSNVSSQIFCS